MKAALAAAAALVLSLALGAGAIAASPIPGTLGLQLSPAPVHLDDGARTITATNLSGGLALTVELVTDPPAYVVVPATFRLEDGASQLLTITAVDPSTDGTLSATATADVAGVVRSAIALKTRLVHATFLERIAEQVGPLAPLAALAALCALLAALWAVRRRMRA